MSTMRRCLRHLSSFVATAILVSGMMSAEALTLANGMWKIDYAVSETSVKAGQILILDVTIEPLVKTYDFRLEVVSSPVRLVSDSVLSFKELPAGIRQATKFQVRIPENALKSTQYQIDLRIEGFKTPPLFDLFGIWRPHKILFWGEDPSILDSRGGLNSIKLTVM